MNILRKHGVESVALLYPENRKAQRWLGDAEKIIFDDLHPIDPFIDAVIKLEIPAFFKNPDLDRTKYISRLFNSSFFWHLIQVDEKCSNLLKTVTKGQKLYLDNNILYSIVGFHGSEILYSIHNMMKFAKLLGYELWVTTKTLSEFQNSLLWRMNILKELPQPPRELARIALLKLSKDSFLTYYWQEFVKNGTSIEEFIAEKSNIGELLNGLGIQTTGDFREEIEKSDELRSEMSILRNTLIGIRSENQIEHDAFHRILINKYRGTPKYKYRDAMAWFLTHDTLLPAYGRVARKGKNYIPFCITTDQWIQINRPLLARTSNEEEYEKSFHSLVTQPFLRVIISSFSLEEITHEILGKLARYENMSPQLALEIITDTHFMVSMVGEKDNSKKEAILNNKFITLAADLETQKTDLEKNKSEIEESGKILTHEVSLLKEKLEYQQSEITKVKDALKSEIKKKEDLRGEFLILKGDNKETEKHKNVLENQFLDYRKKVKRWSIFILSSIILSILLWTQPLWLSLTWLTGHSKHINIKMAIQIIIFSSLLCIPLGKHWKIWIVIISALFILILGFDYFQQ